ncbi:CHAP domain-containing protein [Oceaniferula spumae]
MVTIPSGVGKVVEREQGIAVYAYDSEPPAIRGKSTAKDGYCYGEKWQSTEFVRRFYDVGFNYRMPYDPGYAKNYFNPEIAHGAINPALGLVQYKNNHAHKPEAGDLLVFIEGKRGHIALISKVDGDVVEVVQQNMEDQPRAQMQLEWRNNGWRITGQKEPAGWLRLSTARVHTSHEHDGSHDS